MLEGTDSKADRYGARSSLPLVKEVLLSGHKQNKKIKISSCQPPTKNRRAHLKKDAGRESKMGGGQKGLRAFLSLEGT